MNPLPRRKIDGALVLLLVLVGRTWGDPGKTGRMERPPQSAEQWRARAKEYDEKAAFWRNEAERHRRMAIDFRRSSTNPHDPEVVRMERHCAGIEKVAEKIVAEAESQADESRRQARQLEER